MRKIWIFKGLQSLRIYKIILAVLSGLLLLPFAVNITDEELESGPNKILNSSQPSMTSTNENGYFALLGFEAPVGKDIVEAGKRVYFAYSNSQVGESPQAALSLEAAAGPSPYMIRPHEIPRCSSDQSGCLEMYLGKQRQVEDLLSENALLLDRYRSLYDYSIFQDLSTPAPWAPKVNLGGAIYGGHNLILAETALLFNGKEEDKALQSLVTDALLWRKILTGVVDIQGKDYALSALQSNYQLLNEMIAALPAGEAKRSIDSRILQPLSHQEKSQDLAWDREFISLAVSLHHQQWPHKEPEEAGISILENYFLKQKATLNDAYEMFQIMKRIAPMTPEDYKRNRDGTFQKRLEEARLIRFNLLYNPLGKRFVAKMFYKGAVDVWNRRINELNEMIRRIDEHEAPVKRKDIPIRQSR